MIKWKCELRWGGQPEPVEVVGETECFVTVRQKSFSIGGDDKYKERRIKKDGTIHDTFEDAKTALVNDAKMRVTQAEAEWQRAKDRLQKCNNLKAPNTELTGRVTGPND